MELQRGRSGDSGPPSLSHRGTVVQRELQVLDTGAASPVSVSPPPSTPPTSSGPSGGEPQRPRHLPSNPSPHAYALEMHRGPRDGVRNAGHVAEGLSGEEQLLLRKEVDNLNARTMQHHKEIRQLMVKNEDLVALCKDVSGCSAVAVA